MSTHRDFADAPSARRSPRGKLATIVSPRTLESRQSRRYKSKRKRLRAQVRNRRQRDDYQSLLQLLSSMERFESLKHLVPLSSQASPLLRAIYPLVEKARDYQELEFVLYEELRHRFPLIDVYHKWYRESALKFEISYRSSDIFRARPEAGSPFPPGHDTESYGMTYRDQ